MLQRIFVIFFGRYLCHRWVVDRIAASFERYGKDPTLYIDSMDAAIWQDGM